MVLSLTAFLRESGFQRRDIARKTGIPELLSLKPGDWVAYDTYLKLVNFPSEQLSDEEWTDAGRRLFEVRGLRVLAPVVGWTIPSVAGAYDWLLSYSFGPDSGGFRTVTFALVRVAPGQLRVVLRPPRGKPLPHGLVLITAGALEVVPTLVGAGAAKVLQRLHQGDAVFDIRFKERPLWSFIRTFVNAWAPGAARAARRREEFDLARGGSLMERKEAALERMATGEHESLAGIPERIGEKYRVIRIIGHGSMGMVYLAVQEPGTRRVAIKVLSVNPKAHHGSFEDHNRVFLRGARSLSRLDSRYIVKLHDYGLDGRVPFLVLQFVEGPSLEELMLRGALPVEDAERIFKQICKALRDAHALGIMHRDLSPGNIIIDRVTGIVKVLDFGLAKFEGEDDELSVVGRVVGTQWYVAPEVLAGEADVRGDLYAAGMLLYRMLTGRFPYDATSADVMVGNLKGGPRTFRDVAPHRGLPRRLERIAMRCLERDPDRRYQTAIDVLDALATPEPSPWPLRIALGAMVTVSAIALVWWLAGSTS